MQFGNFFSVERRTWIKHDLKKKAKIIIRPFAQPLEATRKMNRNFFPRGNRIIKFPEQFQSKKIADPELKNMILILKLWNVQPYFIYSVKRAKISNTSNLFLTLEGAKKLTARDWIKNRQFSESGVKLKWTNCDTIMLSRRS